MTGGRLGWALWLPGCSCGVVGLAVVAQHASGGPLGGLWGV